MINNYLNQLVVKNLNLIDTVQPFLLPVFGYIRESPVEIGNSQSWAINQEFVMSDGEDSSITTELETSREADKLTNSTSRQFTQKELETMYNLSIVKGQLVTESSGQQPVKVNQVFPPPAESKEIGEELSSHQSQLQPVEITRASSNTARDSKNFQLRLHGSGEQGAGEKTNLPFSEPTVKSPEHSVPLLSRLQGIEINRSVSSSPSSKVVSSSPLSAQFDLKATVERDTAFSSPLREQLPKSVNESKKRQSVEAYSDPNISLSSKILNYSPLSAQFNSEPTVEGDTAFSSPLREQLPKSVDESKKRQSVEAYSAQNISLSSKVVSSSPSSAQFNSEATVERDTAFSSPVVEQLPKSVNELKKLQPVETYSAQNISPSPKILPITYYLLLLPNDNAFGTNRAVLF